MEKVDYMSTENIAIRDNHHSFDTIRDLFYAGLMFEIFEILLIEGANEADIVSKINLNQNIKFKKICKPIDRSSIHPKLMLLIDNGILERVDLGKVREGFGLTTYGLDAIAQHIPILAWGVIHAKKMRGKVIP